MFASRTKRGLDRDIRFVSFFERSGPRDFALSPIIEQEDAQDEVIGDLGIEVSRRNQSLENDPQLCEVFWTHRGVQGRSASLGDLSWE